MADTRPSRIVPLLFVVIVVAAAATGTALLYEFNHPKAGTPIRAVVNGDNVTVNYIGFFGSGPQTGRVFDTSIYSVGINNASYPKSLEWSRGTNPSGYTPLPVHVGPSAPSGGYSLAGKTFSTVVPGFWQGLIGLTVNRTAWLTIPPSLGYGAPNASCYVTQPLTVQVPVVLTLTTSQFTAAYPGANSTPGTEFTDPTYGWTDLVLSHNTTGVVVENLASVGWSVPGKGWAEVVTAVNSTTVTVTNQLSGADTGLVAGTSKSQVCGTGQFIVSAVDPTAGTYTEDFNREVVGQTLIFEVSVVQFYG